MTDLWDGALIDCRIWHARSGDVQREFRYRATYVALPVDAFDASQLPLRPDARGIWSIRLRDHGARDGTPLGAFIRGEFEPVGLGHCDVTLVTMTRSPGYGFNPVSFWLARDAEGLRAVLAEVSNTFGERHFYLCRHPDNRPIARSDRIAGEKIFHVSPFLPREGAYVFRFDPGPDRFGAWVDWIGEGGEVRLRTSMAGPARAMSAAALRRAQLRHPFQAQKVIALIHWQAAKLVLRGVRYISKPKQLTRRNSEAKDRVPRDV
ncbi:MAG: DUF1365 domain-containing protein [Rhodobacteraceae bacterium]|jgi:DUF1365 family protein|uniref:Uncharacterized protein n=1 Tax=Salipiger profundus TaxID=1229727 RepID=A0A1U7D2K4_9RHOB|nr:MULTISPECIES: DUF1365 domain-containing protein [Salipiger]APX22352.1 hypothetical protein Ga0080559_TMP1556 [Salipiger profundus]MAB05637.1 DUF1365 domain-containing protein [Paracoccaceae bacterium]GGA22606.1 DUF1365 domain-containing protein [Salipiger profundus]SFD66210.1 hypothetical protein SAMN05444415_11455 [Salipiger profundus]